MTNNSENSNVDTTEDGDGKPKNRKILCRIGIECPDSPCPNRETCYDLGISWELPYTRTKTELTVKSHAKRYDWSELERDDDCSWAWCPVDGGCYIEKTAGIDVSSSEMSERILSEWCEAGWCAPDYKPHHRNSSDSYDDDIPFKIFSGWSYIKLHRYYDGSFSSIADFVNE